MSNYRKVIAAVIGAIGTALTLGVAPEAWADYLAIAIQFLTALGVYAVPNTPVE